jgi:tetratricopeptide (TPR) repeat protein
MENILKIVNCLKPGEVKLVRHFYSLQNDYELKKREKLFVLAMAKPDCSDEEALRYLYGSRPDPAFRRLKQRLKADILNLLLIQGASAKFKSAYAQAVFDCRRMLIQGEILLSRGVYEEAIDVLGKAAALAQRYELFAEQVQIDDIYMTHIVMKDGGKDFDSLAERISGSVKLLEKAACAKRDHYALTVPGLFRGDCKKELQERAPAYLKKMETDFQSTGSKRIGFYFHVSAMNYYNTVKDFEQALHHGKELLHLVNSCDVFRMDSYLAGVNMQIASTLITLERYDEALKHASIAHSLFKPGMLNELMALEKLYYCYIRKGELVKARDIIGRAFANENLGYNESISARWWFFKTGLEFLQGDHEKALKSLKNCNALLRDKAGWMLGHCILEVMCRVENGNLDWFEIRAEGLKKVLKRHVNPENTGIDKRIILIYKIMKKLRRMDYNFSRTIKEEAENLALLSEGKGQYYWNPAGHELVRFDEWIKSKVQRSSKKGTSTASKAA